jgi:hypothetical protein
VQVRSDPTAFSHCRSVVAAWVWSKRAQTPIPDSSWHSRRSSFRIQSLLQSIRREIHALARIQHPGIVRIVAEGLQTGCLGTPCSSSRDSSFASIVRCTRDSALLLLSAVSTPVGEPRPGLVRERTPVTPVDPVSGGAQRLDLPRRRRWRRLWRPEWKRDSVAGSSRRPTPRARAFGIAPRRSRL